MKHASLFSGIGGFDLAADWMGWENIFHCEINSFNKKVLKYYWPNAVSYDDITKTDFIIHRGTIDVLTGGFPCQPFSVAGKRHGTEDNRYLWPEMLRSIRGIQPSWVVGENVRGIVNWSGGLVFDQVQADLEAEWYKVLPIILPACAVNAPHRRERVWFVANRNSLGCNNGGDNREERHLQGNWRTTPESESERHGRECRACKAGEATQNPMHSGCVQREPKQEGTEDGQQRDIGAGNSKRVCLSEGTTADTTSQRGERIESGEQPETGKPKQGQFRGGDCENATANTSNKRLQGCEIYRSVGTGRQKPQQQPTGRIRYFSNFPTTQPTIRSGNDGISDRLDGITFSKWRSESIKAYGNAVVPQVVLEIFKVIDKMTNKI